MRPPVLAFLQAHKPFVPHRVLDVGSYDVNGSARATIETWGSDYLGVDMREGPNVEVVCRAEDLVAEFGAGAFDAVVSFDTLEHMEDWQACLTAMKAVCAEAGGCVSRPGRDTQ